MYEIIFNAITVESLKKFLKISGNDTIKKNQSKQNLIVEIQKEIKADTVFKNKFVNYFKEIEKAGRKDFWFAEMKRTLTSTEIKEIQDRVKKFAKESNNLFIPSDISDEKYLGVTNTTSLIEVKVIRKKIISERDDLQTKTENNILFVAYLQTEIRHVSYYRLDFRFKKPKLLIGIDVWQNLNTKQKLKEAENDIKKIFGAKIFALVTYIDLKKKSSNLIDLENVITKESSDKIVNTNGSVAFSIDTEKIKVIRKELNDGTLKLDKIKSTHYTDDVRNNEVFKAAQTKSVTLATKACKGTLFYFSSLTNEHEYFRFELHAAESRIKILNDHIIPDDLKDVFSKIN